MRLLNLIGSDTDEVRIAWVRRCLRSLPAGSRILDAGAGELKFRTDFRVPDDVVEYFCQIYHLFQAIISVRCWGVSRFYR